MVAGVVVLFIDRLHRRIVPTRPPDVVIQQTRFSRTWLCLDQWRLVWPGAIIAGGKGTGKAQAGPLLE